MLSKEDCTSFFAIRLPDATEIIRGASLHVADGLSEGFFFSPFGLDAPVSTIPAGYGFTDREAAEWRPG